METGLLILLGAMCAALLSVALLRRSKERSVTARDLTREQLARQRDLRQIHTSIEDILLQVEELSQRMNAQIDAKTAALNEALRKADEQIAKLERSRTGRSGALGTSGEYATRRAGTEKVVGQPAVMAPGSNAPPPVATRPVEARGDIVPRAIPALLASSEVGRPELTRGERRRRIYELADGGHAAMAIADALRIPLGEVEMILNLRGYARTDERHGSAGGAV